MMHRLVDKTLNFNPMARAPRGVGKERERGKDKLIQGRSS
jgi:hypothetical protein